MLMPALFQDVAILVMTNVRVNRAAGEHDAGNVGGLERSLQLEMTSPRRRQMKRTNHKGHKGTRSFWPFFSFVHLRVLCG
jgi:hypothetical protein